MKKKLKVKIMEIRLFYIYPNSVMLLLEKLCILLEKMTSLCTVLRVTSHWVKASFICFCLTIREKQTNNDLKSYLGITY